MTKPFLLSAFIHVLLLSTLLMVASLGEKQELTVNTVSIRLMNRSDGKRTSPGPRTASPAESYRQNRKSANIPLGTSGEQISEAVSLPDISRFPVRNIEVAAVGTAGPPRSQVRKTIQTDPLGSIDPLSGLEDALLGESPDENHTENPWFVSWANGKERGILSFPMIDLDEFPEETERLLNVTVSIRVSPQGEVLSAEIVSPGSGDIRIDRYMHSVALQLVLEPWPEGENVQDASLRLLFLEGRQ